MMEIYFWVILHDKRARLRDHQYLNLSHRCNSTLERYTGGKNHPSFFYVYSVARTCRFQSLCAHLKRRIHVHDSCDAHDWIAHVWLYILTQRDWQDSYKLVWLSLPLSRNHTCSLLVVLERYIEHDYPDCTHRSCCIFADIQEMMARTMDREYSHIFDELNRTSFPTSCAFWIW